MSVCVYGRPVSSIAAFRQQDLATSVLTFSLSISCLRFRMRTLLHPNYLMTRLPVAFSLSHCVPASQLKRRYGIVYPFAIDYASWPGLRTRLTLGGRASQETLISDGKDSHLALVTYSDIRTTHKSTAPYGTASPPRVRSPYQQFICPASSV